MVAKIKIIMGRGACHSGGLGFFRSEKRLTMAVPESSCTVKKELEFRIPNT